MIARSTASRRRVRAPSSPPARRQMRRMPESLHGRKVVAMWIGWIEFDLLLGDVHSLKEKRSIVRPLLAGLSRRTEAAAAEVDFHDLHRRAAIGVSVVGADASHVRVVLDHA